MKRALTYAGVLAGVVLAGIALRALDPAAFARFSREEGIWEPLTVTAYLSAAAVLLHSPRRSLRERKHYQLLAGVFILLALEETDYFSIFGGFIGRIEGVYVGSPHDLIRLWERGLLPPIVAALAALLVLAAAASLWRTGYLQPRAILRLLRTLAAPWLLLGGSLIVLGQLDDAGLMYLLEPPRVEELLELAGAVSLLAFAIEAALLAPARPPEHPAAAANHLTAAS